MNISGLGFGSQSLSYNIMQSQQDADKAIAAFEEVIRQGYNPNDVSKEVFARIGVDPSDLMDYDYKRVQKRVTEIYHLYND